MSLIQQVVELQNIDSKLQDISELLGDLPIKVEELKDKEDSLIQSVEKAKIQIESESQEAMQKIKSTVVDLSIEAAAKIIEKNLDSEDNRKLVNETIDKVGQA